MQPIKNLSHAQEEIPEELEAVKAWWAAHGNVVTIVLCVLLVVVLGSRQLRHWRESRRESAMVALRAAGDAETLEKTIAEAKVAAVVPLARLRLAAVYYEDGKYDLARAAYEAFLADTPNHANADVARLGLAFCDEAAGEPAKAASAFEAFLADSPDSYLAPHARLGYARCLLLQPSEESKRAGKAALDEYLTENAGTFWATLTDELIHARARLSVPASDAPASAAEAFLEATAEPAPAE